MSTHAIRAAEARITETPNATMTTFASPSQGGTSNLSLWQVDMRSGATGPMHVFDSEQIWTVAAGIVSFIVDGEAVELATGDSLVLPGGAQRQVAAATDARMIVCGHATAIVSVVAEEAPRGTPPWVS